MTEQAVFARETIAGNIVKFAERSKLQLHPGRNAYMWADLFKAEGERIGFGSRKGDIKLEAVVTYVERVADLHL